MWSDWALRIQIFSGSCTSILGQSNSDLHVLHFCIFLCDYTWLISLSLSLYLTIPQVDESDVQTCPNKLMKQQKSSRAHLGDRRNAMRHVSELDALSAQRPIKNPDSMEHIWTHESPKTKRDLWWFLYVFVFLLVGFHVHQFHGWTSWTQMSNVASPWCGTWQVAMQTWQVIHPIWSHPIAYIKSIHLP